MGAGIVTIGRRVYAVGLYWENSPSGRISQAAKEAASQPGQQADFYAIRPGDKTGRVPQFGLGQIAAGHKTGMPVFAACLANQQPGSWGGAFRLREGTVITVVRDDLIVPDGDQYFASESEARDRLLQEIGFGGLQRVYAPESWAISGSDTMPVSLLLDERRDVRLRPVKIPKQVLVIGAIAAAVLVLLLGGGWYYQNLQAEKEAEAAAKEDALRRARDLANHANPFATQGPQYPPPERVWENRPNAMAVINSCHTGLAQVRIAVVGWKLGEVKCDGSVIALGWSRDKGLSQPPEGSTVDDAGSLANSKVVLPSLTPRGHEDLIGHNDITRRYLLQDWPGRIQHAPDDPAPLPPPGYQGTWTPPPAPWVKRSFTVTVPELPSSMALYFGDLPGVVVNSMSYTGNGWTIEGVVYENRT